MAALWGTFEWGTQEWGKGGVVLDQRGGGTIVLPVTHRRLVDPDEELVDLIVSGVL